MIVANRHQTDYFSPTRCDRQLKEAALAVINNSKYTALRQLRCSVIDGVVEISGTVPSFYMKQLAQAAIMRLDGVCSVRNLVRVSGESPVVAAKSCA